MTKALFLGTVQQKARLERQGERRLNVTGVLKISGVSRSGYLHFKKRLPSKREINKQDLKKRIREIP